MADKKILQYIREGRHVGLDDATIRKNLADTGWSESDIAQGFTRVDDPREPATNIPSIKNLFKAAWSLYQGNWKNLLVITAIPSVLIAAISSLFSYGANLYRNQALDNSVIFLTLGAILGLVLIYLAIWAQVSLIVAIRDNAPATSAWQTFKTSRVYIYPFILTSILSWLVILGGIFLMIVPGILFGVGFGMATLALVVEGRSAGWSSMIRSWGLIYHNLWSVIWRYLGIGFFTWLVYFMVNLPFTATSNNESLANSVMSLILSIVLGPLTLSYIYFLFKSLQTSVPLTSEVDNLASAEIKTVARRGAYALAVLILVIVILVVISNRG